MLVIQSKGFYLLKCLCSHPLLSIPQHWLFHLRRCRGFIPALLISCCTVPHYLKPGFDWVTPLLKNLEWPLVAFFKVFSNPGLLFKAPITCLSYLCSFLITPLPVPEIMLPSPGPRLSPGTTSFFQASFPLADLPCPTSSLPLPYPQVKTY